MAYILLSSLLFIASSGADVVSREASPQCLCGYRDNNTNTLYTDAIIAYFNETTQVNTTLFHIEDFANRNEKGWNTIFKNGASPANLHFGNESLPWQSQEQSLEMFLDGLRFDHLSNGAAFHTMRQDIMYGTFRAGMRSPAPWVGGSALSMSMKYNASKSVQLDLLNMNDANQARVMQTINGEYPDNSLALNYSYIQEGSVTVPPHSPWDFMDVGFDWSADNVSFWVGSNMTRLATKSERTLPDVPLPLRFAHWSTGDPNYMQGPPVNRSLANVLYIRAFFNSSVMNAHDHAAYDERCLNVLPCSVDDVHLRESSEYTAASLLPYKPPRVIDNIKVVAGYVAAAFSTFGVAALLNAFIRRTPWHKVHFKYFANRKNARSAKHLRQSIRQSLHQDQPAPSSFDDLARPDSAPSIPGYLSPGMMTPLPVYQSRQHSPFDTPAGPSAANSRSGSIKHGGTMKLSSLDTEVVDVSERRVEEEEMAAARVEAYRSLNGSVADADAIEVVSNGNSNRASADTNAEKKNFEVTTVEVPEIPHEPTAANMMRVQGVPDPMTGVATADPTKEQKPVVKQQRIDYLAGLVAVCCILVTFRHFSLTFWPYVTEGQGYIKHFEADQWLSYVLGPYPLTPLVIGPFFVTACRFLAQRYLRTGKLDDVANKMLLRAPRMLIPCFIFMALEYFLISLGLTKWLQWLPSVGYSQWPYVTPQGNFGIFFNDVVQLAYIIPNQAPEIINHYCVGILWTIPVQLQFSFVVLMATVIIRDVKTPWKRFAFYWVTIIAGWYANSWSACHWLGLMLADMDLTYGWIKWTQARWWALYPVLFLSTVVLFVSPLALLFNSAVLDWSFPSYENSIHPNVLTGRPIAVGLPNIWAAYPAYNAPNLIVLTFSVSIQIIVELSTWTQKVLSLPFITFLHPHIMTIYLTHGFIFWSLGAFIMVQLSNTNLPYWAMLLITAVCCYTVILNLAVMLTPMTDFATKGSTKNIWRWATEAPVPHRPTTAPFGKDLVIGREDKPVEEMGQA